MLRAVASSCIGVGLALEDNLKLISELGFTEVDLLLVSGWAHIGTDELSANYSNVLKRIERALAAANVAPAAVNAKFSVPLECAGEYVQREREADALINLMRDLGVARASIQPTLSNDIELLNAGFAATMAEVVWLQTKFEERGMLLSLEPHIMSAFCTCARLRKARAKYPRFPITFDPSHLLHEGETMPDIEWLYPMTSMVHLRDAAPGKLFALYGEGALDLERCVTGLKAANYAGPIAIEYITQLAPDALTLKNLRAFREEIERLIAEP